MKETNVTKSALEALPCLSVITILEELYGNLMQLESCGDEGSFERRRYLRLQKIIKAIENHLLDCADALTPPDASEATEG